MSFKNKFKWSVVTMLLFILFSISQVFAAHWTKLNHDWYHFNDKNEMEVSRWIKWSDKWYYVGESGKMQRGWFNEPLTNFTYYFDNKEDTGHAYKWVQPVETNYYYFDGNNRLVKYDASANNSGSSSGKQKINNSEFYVDEFGRVVRADGSVIKTSDNDAPKVGDSLGAPPTVSDDIVVRPEAGKGGSSGGGGGSSGGSSGGGSTPTPPGPTPPTPTGPLFVLPATMESLGTTPPYVAITTEGTKIKTVVANAGLTSIKYKFIAGANLSDSTYSSFTELNQGSQSVRCKVGILNTNELTFVTDGGGFKYPDAASILGTFDSILFYPGIASLVGLSFGYDVTSIDVSNTYMGNDNKLSGLFYGLKELTSISNLSSFDTTGCIDMINLFAGCEKLASIDVSGFDTSSCTILANTFNRCDLLTSADFDAIKNWDVSNVLYMSSTFAGCYALTNLNFLSTWNVSNVIEIGSIFADCSGLNDINGVKDWNISKAQLMNGAFHGCTSLTNVTLNWHTDLVTNMNGLFEDANQLTTVTFGSNFIFNTTNPPKLVQMFANCTSLTTVDFSYTDFNPSQATCGDSEGVNNMFYDCNALNKIKAKDASFQIIWGAQGPAGTANSKLSDLWTFGYNETGSSDPKTYTKKLTTAPPPLGSAFLGSSFGEEPEEDEATPSDIPRTSLFGLTQVNNENGGVENEPEEDIVASPSDITAVNNENTEEQEENNDGEINDVQEENNSEEAQEENNGASSSEGNNTSNEPVENNTSNEPKENNDNEESPKEEGSSTQNEGN